MKWCTILKHGFSLFMPIQCRRTLPNQYIPFIFLGGNMLNSYNSSRIFVILLAGIGMIPLIGGQIVFPIALFLVENKKIVIKWFSVFSIFKSVIYLGSIILMVMSYSGIIALAVIAMTVTDIITIYKVLWIDGKAWLDLYQKWNVNKRIFLLRAIKIRLVAFTKIGLLQTGVVMVIFISLLMGCYVIKGIEMYENDLIIKGIYFLGSENIENISESSNDVKMESSNEEQIIQNAEGLVYEIEVTEEIVMNEKSKGLKSNFEIFAALGVSGIYGVYIIIQILSAYYICMIGKKIEHALGVLKI